LRLSCERLHRFADIAAVDAALEELAERYPPRTVKLPRAGGEREARWAQLLCGEVALPAPGALAADHSVGAGELAALKAEQTRLAAEVSELRALVQRMAQELGIT
jgi:uncharacterized protein